MMTYQIQGREYQYSHSAHEPCQRPAFCSVAREQAFGLPKRQGPMLGLHAQDKRQHLAQNAKEDISVEGALMGLIHDDGTVVVQIALPQRLPQQHAIRHVLDD